MALTRSTGIQDTETSIQKRTKTLDDSVVGPWPSLHHDVLFLIVMKLGVIDFIAFSGVCTTWRSFALLNRNVFMTSRQPMSMTIHPHVTRACSLVDSDGRRYKTLLPSFSDRICVGVSCGYLIMLGTILSDFWLVNPITRHDLNFPVLPSSLNFLPTDIRAILVFSLSLSRYVLVITFIFSKTILYCSSGGGVSWKFYFSNVPVNNLHAFKGRVYILNINIELHELRLNPQPRSVPLRIKKGPEASLIFPELISSKEKLYIYGSAFLLSSVAFELDFERMEWASLPVGENTMYLCTLKSCAVVESKKTVDPINHLPLKIYSLGHNKIVGAMEDSWNKAYTNKAFVPTVWYFPHECYNINLLED